MTAATTTSTPNPTASASPKPRSGGARILAVDATRGLALVGMMAVHSLMESTPDGSPTIAFTVFAGRASAAYAVLAGVSIVLISGRPRLPQGTAGTGRIAGLVARAFLIGAIGLLLGPITDAEYAVVILPYYALMFLLATPLARMRTRHLALLVPVLLIATPILSQALRPYLPAPILHQMTFGDLLHTPGNALSTLFFTGEFPAIVWMTYLVAGMVVGRLYLRSMKVAVGLLVSGLTMMAVAPVLSWFLLDVLGGSSALTGPGTAELLAYGADGTVPTTSWWWLAVDLPHTGAPLDLLATIGSTFAVLGALLLLRMLTQGASGRVVRLLMLPLVAAGAMSLTTYVAHILFINSDLDVYSPEGGYVRQLLVIGSFAVLWRMTAGRGPLEGLIRSCTRRVDRWTREFFDSRAIRAS